MIFGIKCSLEDASDLIRQSQAQVTLPKLSFYTQSHCQKVEWH